MARSERHHAQLARIAVRDRLATDTHRPAETLPRCIGTSPLRCSAALEEIPASGTAVRSSRGAPAQAASRPWPFHQHLSKAKTIVHDRREELRDDHGRCG